jgi:hypothetical protein
MSMDFNNGRKAATAVFTKKSGCWIVAWSKDLWNA